LAFWATAISRPLAGGTCWPWHRVLQCCPHAPLPRRYEQLTGKSPRWWSRSAQGQMHRVETPRPMLVCRCRS
jgi:hypothetical protein